MDRPSSGEINLSTLLLKPPESLQKAPGHVPIHLSIHLFINPFARRYIFSNQLLRHLQNRFPIAFGFLSWCGETFPPRRRRRTAAADDDDGHDDDDDDDEDNDDGATMTTTPTTMTTTTTTATMTTPTTTVDVNCKHNIKHRLKRAYSCELR